LVAGASAPAARGEGPGQPCGVFGIRKTRSHGREPAAPPCGRSRGRRKQGPARGSQPPSGDRLNRVRSGDRLWRALEGSRRLRPAEALAGEAPRSGERDDVNDARQKQSERAPRASSGLRPVSRGKVGSCGAKGLWSTSGGQRPPRGGTAPREEKALKGKPQGRYRHETRPEGSAGSKAL
jgi:hypothetical protein